MDGTYDVAIIGGGVIGLTTAWMLSDDPTRRIVVIDAGEMGKEASWAGAGILPPGNSDQAENSYDYLRASTVEGFLNLSQRLEVETGISNGYRVCGALDLSRPSTDLIDAWREEGVAFEKVGAPDQRFSGCSIGEAGGFWFPDAAQVRNPWHMKALEAACRKLDVRLLAKTPAESFERTGNRVLAVLTPHGRLVADKFLLCAGAWTDRLLAPLGLKSGIHPVRGQIVLFKEPQPSFDFIIELGRNYIVPRGDGYVLAGSTEEPEAGFEKANTPEGVDALIAFATKLLPALVKAKVEKTWSGLRPGSADGWPFLGALPGFENLFIAAGHFRSGIQTSLATAEAMACLLTGCKPEINLNLFRVGRPVGPRHESLFRS